MAGAYMFKNKAVLVFCPSKNQCEETAKRMAKWMPKLTSNSAFTDISDALRSHV